MALTLAQRSRAHSRHELHVHILTNKIQQTCNFVYYYTHTIEEEQELYPITRKTYPKTLYNYPVTSVFLFGQRASVSIDSTDTSIDPTDTRPSGSCMGAILVTGLFGEERCMFAELLMTHKNGPGPQNKIRYVWLKSRGNTAQLGLLPINWDCYQRLRKKRELRKSSTHAKHLQDADGQPYPSSGLVLWYKCRNHPGAGLAPPPLSHS